MDYSKECSLDQLTPQLRKLLEPHLPDNENILICCETKYSKNLFAQVITEHRIVSAYYDEQKFWGHISGPISKDTAVSLLLSDIVAIEHKYFNLYILTASGPGKVQVHCRFKTRELLNKFMTVLSDKVKQERSISAQHDTEIAGRLRELEQLHREGLIDNIELQEKRREILNRL